MRSCQSSLPSRTLVRVLALATPVGFALALAVQVGAAPVDTADLVLYPASPCAQDSVTVFVRGYVATACDSFVSAERVGERSIRIRTQVHSSIRCFAAPSEFFSVPVPMGRFGAGPQSIEILREIIAVGTGNPPDTARSTEHFSFNVSDLCTDPAVPAEQLPYVVSVATIPAAPCDGNAVALRLDGVFPDGCGRVVFVDPAGLSLVIAPYPPPRTLCTQATQPWRADFRLGRMAAGHHRVGIRMTVLGSNSVWPPIPTQLYVGHFGFDVARECPDLVPYLERVDFAAQYRCPGDPVCPGDSIRVLLSGTFPNECFGVDSLQVFDPPDLSPLPSPPILRLWVRDQGCSRIACSDLPRPWSRMVTLPPLPTRDYMLRIEEVRTIECPPVTDTHFATIPFRVTTAESCLARPACACVLPVWQGEGPPGNPQCAAFISPGGRAQLGLGVKTPVALAGLEGSLLENGLTIVDVEAIGPAAGMYVTWSRSGTAVRFVMFAAQGAPIPATTGEPVPVLRVTVEHRGGGDSRLSLIAGSDFLGSDSQGNAVRSCRGPVQLDIPPTAVVCLEQPDCDFNGDAALDVRDLVKMMRCQRGDDPCPPDVDERFDCDHDLQFGLNDVLCCASALLRLPGCVGCPADTVRPAPGVRVVLRDPEFGAAGVNVQMDVVGNGGVGAARIGLRYPADRYRVMGVTSSALELYQVDDDALAIGVIGPFAVYDLLPGQIPPGDVVVRLELLPGREHGGEIEVTDGEFSGQDGVLLGVDLGNPRLPLTVPGGSHGTVFLSAARPNPFRGETRFSVTLERPGRLAVAIHDLAGRRVAQLFDGPAEAGPHDFLWRGTSADGGSVPGGIYFVRASADGRTSTRRMVMLGGR